MSPDWWPPEPSRAVNLAAFVELRTRPCESTTGEWQIVGFLPDGRAWNVEAGFGSRDDAVARLSFLTRAAG